MIYVAFGSGLAVLLAVIYGLYTRLIFNKKTEQPLKSKAPAMLMLSLTGNSVSVLSLCFVLAFGSSIPCAYIGLVASEVIAMPLMFCPYIYRYRGLSTL